MDLPLQRKAPAKKYGKAARRSLTLPSPSTRARLSDSSDSDDTVASSLLGGSHGANKATAADKGKGKAAEPTAAPPRRAQTTNAVERAGKGAGSSTAKAMTGSRMSGDATASATIPEPKGMKETVWDEEAVMASKRTDAGPSRQTRKSAPSTSRLGKAAPSPSPPKRARISASLSTSPTKPSPRSSPAKFTIPVEAKDPSDTLETVAAPDDATSGATKHPSPRKAAVNAELVMPDSPPRRKRPRTRPAEPPTGASITSAPKAPAAVASVRAAAPLGASAETTAATATTATATLHPATSSSPQPIPPRPRTPEPSTNTKSLPASPSALKSPAKDLSSVFQQFASVQQQVGGVKPGVTAGLKRSASKLAGRSTERSRSPDRLSRDNSLVPSPERAISKSAPPLSPVSSRHASPVRALGPSSSQPQLGSPARPVSPNKVQSRPLNRTNTAPLTLGGTVVDASALGPRGAAGSRKTYGGARSFKRDVEEEKIFASVAPAAEAHAAPPTPAAGLSMNKSSPASASNSTRKLLLPLLPRPPQERRSYAAMRAALGVDEDELMEEEMSQGASALKSITQLKAKGENSRFVDEFNYLVEGLQKGETLSGRRATAIEILRKMLSKDFVRRLKASGFDERAYNEFRKAEAGEGDRILDPALAFLVATLARDQRIAEALCRISTSTFGSTTTAPSTIDEEAIYDEPTCDVLSVLGQMLGRSWAGEEIGKKNQKGLSKSDARMLMTIREVVDEAKLIDDSSLPVNLRSLSLIAISIIASFSPRAIFRPQHLLCTSGALDAVVAAFVHETKGLPTRLSRYESSGLDLLPADGSINLNFIDLCLRVFEASTSATPLANAILTSHSPALAPALVHLIHACHVLALDSGSHSTAEAEKRKVTASSAMEVLLSAVRMLVEMTTADPEWSVEVSRVQGVVGVLIKLIVATRSGDSSFGARFREVDSPMVENEASEGEEVGPAEAQRKAEAREGVRFDLLCLALGVLTNLVETVEGMRDVIRETSIDPDCKEQRKCAKQCHCPGRTTAIHRLTALYLDPLEDSSNELNSSFVNGYSGILLGLVMLDSPVNQGIVTEALAPHPEAKAKLIEAMEEFATLHETHEKAERDERDRVRAEEGSQAGVSQGTVMDEDGEELEREPGRGGGEIAQKIKMMLLKVKGQ